MAIKILQLGCGIRGRQWARFLKLRRDYECVGLIDPDLEAQKKTKTIIGKNNCRCFTNLEDALHDAKADAALIATPSDTHADLTVRCLNAGLNVMVEKPLAINIEEGRWVLDCARKLKKQVITAENYRFWPSERTVGRLLREDFLGKIDNAIVIDRRNQPGREGPSWVTKLNYVQLQEIATHHFDSMRYFFGAKPKSITAHVWNSSSSDYQHGAHTEALVTFADVRVQYVGTMFSHRYGFSLWIEGERGTLWTNRKYVAWRPYGSRFFRPIRCDKVPSGDEKSYPQGGTTSLLNSLRDAINHGMLAETSVEDNIWTVAMIDAGKLSDKDRRTVDLSEKFS